VRGEGPVAGEIWDLWWLLLGLGVAVYVLVMGLLVAAVARRRRGEPDDHGDIAVGAGGAPSRPPVPRRLASRWIVGGGLVLPLVVLPVVLASSVGTLRGIPQSAGQGGLVVEVVGHQWWWSVHYPDHGVTVANEIHIPVGRRVAFHLTSADVIHSFWVPKLAGKLDALPDGTNVLVVEAAEAGEYRGHCAEFCGLQHAKMGLLVVAEPPERFQAWVEDQRRPAAEPATASAAAGREVFAASGCGACHTVRGTGAAGTGGPDLTHVGSRRTLAAATVVNDPVHLARWLDDPASVKEGTRMPHTPLGERDLAALVEYLRGLE
jgi:cytochrome c oxidase subunit 2